MDFTSVVLQGRKNAGGDSKMRDIPTERPQYPFFHSNSFTSCALAYRLDIRGLRNLQQPLPTPSDPILISRSHGNHSTSYSSSAETATRWYEA